MGTEYLNLGLVKSNDYVREREIEEFSEDANIESNKEKSQIVLLRLEGGINYKILEEDYFLYKLGKILYSFFDTAFTIICKERMIHPNHAFTSEVTFSHEFPKYIFPAAKEYLNIVSKKIANLFIEEAILGITFTILNQNMKILRFMFEFYIETIINENVEITEELLKSIKSKLSSILINLKKFSVETPNIPNTGANSPTVRIGLILNKKGNQKFHNQFTSPEEYEHFPWKKVKDSISASANIKEHHGQRNQNQNDFNFVTSVDESQVNCTSSTNNEKLSTATPKFGTSIKEMTKTNIVGIDFAEFMDKKFCINLSAVIYPELQPSKIKISSLPLFKKNNFILRNNLNVNLSSKLKKINSKAKQAI